MLKKRHFRLIIIIFSKRFIKQSYFWNMEMLRYFIFFYCILGFFVAGGLFFKNRNLSTISLSFFIVLFTLEMLSFLYETSEVLFLFPQYFLIDFPICLLFGPMLWLHYKYTRKPKKTFSKIDLLHLIPFVLFIVFLLAPLFKLEGLERIQFARNNFLDQIMPLNYVRTTHVTLYGLVLLVLIIKYKAYKENDKGVYLTVVVVIYFLTAVLLSYLTGFADSFRQFVLYYFLASTILLVTGFVLYAYPEILQQLHKKYFSSNLREEDKARVVNKIKALKNEEPLFLDNSLNLKSLCKHIHEKPYYVSQVLSEEFNTSFSDFVNKKRIYFAKNLLINPEKDHLKILAIAYESGFNNDVTFNKAFVKFVGVTPGKYRKNRALLPN